MPLKYSGNIRELCYPFIYEESALCDYEILTDELCTLVGCSITELESDPENRFFDILEFLNELQPKMFHLNGSIRGKGSIHEEDLQRLDGWFDRFEEEIGGRIQSFVLPRGPRSVQLIHSCRSLCKKVVRCLVKIDAEGREVPDVLHRYGNMLCNLLFRVTVVINGRLGITEPEYISPNYPQRPPKKKRS